MNVRKSHNERQKATLKEYPFRVPDGYFENFEARLQEKIKEESKGKAVKDRDVVRSLRPILWIAASFLLVMLVLKYPVRMLTGNSENASDSITTYTQIGMASLDNDDFYDLMSDETKTFPLEQEVITDYLSEELSDTEIYTGLN